MSRDYQGGERSRKREVVRFLRMPVKILKTFLSSKQSPWICVSLGLSPSRPMHCGIPSPFYVSNRPPRLSRNGAKVIENIASDDFNKMNKPDRNGRTPIMCVLENANRTCERSCVESKLKVSQLARRGDCVVHVCSKGHSSSRRGHRYPTFTGTSRF